MTQELIERCLQQACSSADGVVVAVLCVAGNSIYHRMPGTDCYDIKRDVRTYDGTSPVVVHPPCRSWSAYCAHQAKPLPGEKDLGPLCVEHLRRNGGVLEHPAHSRLFAHCGLPRPGEHKDGIWTAEVLQAWWGDTRTKKTWLCFSGISPEDVTFPFRLHDASGDRRRWQVMSKHQRSATNPAMAEWLVAVARKAKGLNSSQTNVSDQATASAADGKHEGQPTSRCLHPFCSPSVSPVDSE